MWGGKIPAWSLAPALIPVNMKSAIDQILNVNSQLFLRLDQCAVRARKIIRCFPGKARVIRANVQNMSGLKSELLDQ
jgi:hypothetical protein